jgi:RHS repeat-associated protein
LTLNTKPPGSGGACSTAAGTTITHTYDTADRLIDSAYTYDTFGRITHVPGRDAGAPLDSGYYVNDLARSITQASKTTTIDLDPNRRPRSRTTTPPGAAELAHYADDTDEPSWTSKGGVTQRDIEGLDGDLAAVKTSGATATLQLVNLHGDVVGEAPASTTPTAPSAKFETDEFGVPRPGRGPIFQVGSTKAALTSAGTSITVAVPEGVQQGDLLLAMFALGNSADTTPTGWTAANANFTNGTTRYRLYYRIATATEPASYAFTISASGIHIASITALRNTATSAPAVTTAKNTSTDITAATITPASGDSAITVFAGQAVGDTNGGSVFDFPTPFTKTFEATSGTSLSAAAALRVLTGAAGVATGPITITSQTGAGSAAWGAITAAIAPANPTPSQTRYGYLGSKQRYTSTGAGIIEMGARLYAPQLGRFLQTDPVPGGSCNDYDYACQDPINNTDLDGTSVVGRRQSYAYHYFRSKGLTRAQAAGVVGNLQFESGGALNPRQAQYGGGPGRGIAQWTYGSSRWTGLVSFAHGRGHSWANFQTQVQYVWHELRTTHSGALSAVKSAGSVSAATDAFMRGYEAPGVPNFADRLRYANQIYHRFGW